MKHEDLQLKVYQIYKNNDACIDEGTDNWVEVDDALLALHSIVALHRPEITDGLVWCTGCDATRLYPCPTINIIHSSLVKYLFTEVIHRAIKGGLNEATRRSDQHL